MSKRTYGNGSCEQIEPGKYRLRCRVKGKQKEKWIDADNQKEAERRLTKWRDELEAKAASLPALPLNDLFDRHLADMRTEGCDPIDIEIVRSRIAKHLRPRFGNQDANTLTLKQVKKYKEDRLGTGSAPATINRELSALRRSLRLAIEDGDLNTLPPVIKPFQERNVRKGFIEPDIYRAIMGELPDTFQKPLWCFAYHLGVRKGELLKLEWDWLLPYWGEPEPIIKVPGYTIDKRHITKSGEPHTIPIYHPEMRWFVQRMIGERNPKCPYLFQFRGDRVKSPKEAFKAACERVGVPAMVFHDTRRTAIRLMEQAGIPRAEAMQITGHKTESVYKRYDIASERGAVSTGCQMRQFLEEQEKLRGKLRGDVSAYPQKGEPGYDSKLFN